MYEERFPIRKFGSESEEIPECCGKLHNKKFHNSYASSDIRAIKSSGI
jgi:hypothetical protein